MRFNDPNDVIALTPKWRGERFADGRPRVPDKYLDALRNMTLEELWKPIFVQGYENQFIAMKCLHPEFDKDGSLNAKLVGRAITAVYGPTRPDYYEASFAQAAAEGRSGTPNQWLIDSLQDGDVAVVDMYDKIYKGTFLGGNLTTAVKAKTGTGGAVIWGGIRDIEQMQRVEGVQLGRACGAVLAGGRGIRLFGWRVVHSATSGGGSGGKRCENEGKRFVWL